MAQGLKDEYSIAAPSIDTHARLLSGGNLQRLIFAREIETGPRFIVAVQPTRGLDIGAIEAVHRVLLDRRAAGTAILLISEDLDEILALADRVDVMYEGRIVGSFPTADADIARIGLLMTGGAEPSEGPAGDDRARRDDRRPMNLRLEPRTDAPRWFTAAMTLAALAFALVLSGLIIWLVGGDPIRSFGHIVVTAFGSVGVDQRHPGQGDAAHPHRAGLLAGVPDAPLEHRR